MGQDANPPGAAGTPVTGQNLLAARYRKFMPPRMDGPGKRRLYQRTFDDDTGRRYWVTFTEYDYMPDGQLTYEADMCMDTDTAGTVWVKLREDTIEATEARAEKMWAATGRVYRSVREEPAADVSAPAPQAAAPGR